MPLKFLDYIGALQLSEAPFLRALAGSQLMEGSLAIALSPSICPGVQCPFGNAAGPKSVLHALCQVVPRAMAGHKLTPSSLGL